MIDIEKYSWSDLEKNKKECAVIRKDCSTARSIINDALTRYIKRKVGARNKKQAENMTLMFKDLEEYQSEREIQDAYGWDFITEKEMDRLIELWRTREKYVNASNKFEDRVTQMVQKAMNSIGDEYIDFLTETEAAEAIAKQREHDILRANMDLEYEKYKRSISNDA